MADDAGAGAGGADAAAAAAAATAAAAAAAAAAKPWYEGKADTDTIGHWQNKLPADVIGDPGKVALEMTKRYREAEKHIGAPPDQIIRLPKDAKDEAGWRDVWGRLGAPKEAKEYDLSAVKSADGTVIDGTLADTIRNAAFSNHIPKDAAAAFAQSIVKHLDDQKASSTLEATTKLAAEQAALKTSWGPNFDLNKLTAMQGAKRLGITPEAIAALEKTTGYAAVMEAMRKVGAGTSEDTFVNGGQDGGSPKTQESAQARLNELMADPAWGKRLTSGDAAAKREFDALTRQITGVSEAA